MTPFEITMRHGDVPAQLDSFIEEKVGRLEKYLAKSSRIEFVLDRANDDYKCEMILHSSRRGGQVVVHDSHAEVRACIDLVFEKMTRKLQKSKDRRKDHHRGTRLGDEATIVRDSEGGVDEPSYEDIVNQQMKGE